MPRALTPLSRLFAWADAFALVPEPGYDLVHSINAVPLLTRRPYLITFEDYMPRVPEDRYIGRLERGLRRKLLSDQCIALVAMSEYALRQFAWQNRGFDGIKNLESKMELIYPAVSLRREEPKRPSGQLRILFVGAAWMRKGVPALLRAHERLRKEGLPIETTIVSALRWSSRGYIGPNEGYDIEGETRRLGLEGVTHYPGLPNADVMRLMEDVDYFVFPSLHETFGYVSLEALSCGTPVIATGTAAQPEIVEDGKCGYLLQFENDTNVGKWAWIYRKQEPGYNEAYAAAVERLADGIVEKLTLCWQNRRDYEAMSAAALQRIRERFLKENARNRLEQLYERCRR